VIENRVALETLVRHAEALGGDFDVAPSVAALAACGDTSLVARLHEVLEQFLQEENFYGRDLIAAVLGGIQGVDALAVLLAASARDLGDDQDGLQAEIIELLDADRAAARPVVLELALSQTPELRRVGLWALGFVLEAQDVGLLATAATDADPTIRTMAIDAIPDPAGNEQAFGVLVEALRDPDEPVRISAASRLGYTGRADALTPLLTLATDPAPRVRCVLAYMLGRLRFPEAVPVLLRLLHDREPPVREHASDALGSVGGPTAVDALLDLAADKNPHLRVQAAKAPAAAIDSDARVTPQLMLLARDDTAAVRAATLGGLAGAVSGTSDWAPLVVKLADDPDPTVRRRVAVVARHLAPDAARAILHRYTNDHDQTLRRIATTELDRAPHPTARRR
jgi:HEAT repeat protein